MKKLTASILVLVMLLGMTACGKESEPTEATGAEQSAATVEETVLLDAMNVKITAKKLEGTVLSLFIENNSDEDLAFRCRDASVNGYMVDAVLGASVASQKTAEDTVEFSASDLEKCGITEIADLEFRFELLLEEEREEYYTGDLIRIETSAAETYQYIYDDSGEVLFEKKGIKAASRGLQTGEQDPALRIYLENNYETTVTVQAKDVSVNGIPLDPLFSIDLTPGRHAVTDLQFPRSELEENTKIQTVEFVLQALDPDSWDIIAEGELVRLEF